MPDCNVSGNEEVLYDEWLTEIYDHSPALSRQSNHKADAFYGEQCRLYGGPVLQVGAATGRYAIAVARAGVDVIGIDISRPMLRYAERKIADEDPGVRARITLLEGDMRDIRSLPHACATALLPGNVFLLNLTVEDQLRALRSVADNLLPGGTLILEAFVPDLRLVNGEITARSAREFIFDVPSLNRSYLCQRTIRVDQMRQLLHHRLIHTVILPGDLLSERRMTEMTYRYVFPFEFEHLLKLAGFTVQTCLSDFDPAIVRRSYDGYQILIAKKDAVATSVH